MASPAPLFGQAIHIPPAHRVTLPDNATVLKIEIAIADSFPKDATVLIDDDQLIMEIPGRGRDVIPLDDRTIGDVADAVQAKYPRVLKVTAFYPLYGASHMEEERTPQPLPYEVKASAGRPSVAIGFGVVFSMEEKDETDDDGLLGQNGFQLDLTGVHQFLRIPNERTWYSPELYLQARLGLYSDQSLNVVTDSAAVQGDDDDDDDSETQLENALQQADQIALTVQPELVIPFGETDAQVAFIPEYGVTWTRLEPYTFPRIVVGGELRDVDDIFAADVRAAALRHLNQTIPLTNYGMNVMLRFIGEERPLFYVGAGYLQKQVIHRGITFRRLGSPGGAPDSTSLRGFSEGVYHGFWRGVFGARIPGVLDVRVDAVTPISQEIGPPVLRLVLAKDFPLVR